MIGESFVHPGHGVFKVRRIDIRRIGGAAVLFAICNTHKNTTYLVPVDNIKDRVSGIRPVLSILEITDIIVWLMQQPVAIDDNTWNRRYREYMEQIQTGDFKAIAQVYRNLYGLRKSKDLSFGERKMIEQCDGLLRAEMEAAKLMGVELESQLQWLQS